MQEKGSARACAIVWNSARVCQWQHKAYKNGRLFANPKAQVKPPPWNIYKDRSKLSTKSFHANRSTHETPALIIDFWSYLTRASCPAGGAILILLALHCNKLMDSPIKPSLNKTTYIKPVSTNMHQHVTVPLIQVWPQATTFTKIPRSPPTTPEPYSRLIAGIPMAEKLKKYLKIIKNPFSIFQPPTAPVLHSTRL